MTSQWVVYCGNGICQSCIQISSYTTRAMGRRSLHTLLKHFMQRILSMATCRMQTSFAKVILLCLSIGVVKLEEQPTYIGSYPWVTEGRTSRGLKITKDDDLQVLKKILDKLQLCVHNCTLLTSCGTQTLLYASLLLFPPLYCYKLPSKSKRLVALSIGKYL